MGNISIGRVLNAFEKSGEDLECAKYNLDKFPKTSNNRAYYSIFDSVKAVLLLNGEEYKSHKQVIATFNKEFVATEIFPKELGRNIMRANRIREDSDYDFDYYVNLNETREQIKTAEHLNSLVYEYIKNWFIKNNVDEKFMKRLEEIHIKH